MEGIKVGDRMMLYVPQFVDPCESVPKKLLTEVEITGSFDFGVIFRYRAKASGAERKGWLNRWEVLRGKEDG